MQLDRFDRRLSYAFLCAGPFLATAVVGFRQLRIPGVYQVIGALLFTAMAIAAWTLGARAIRGDVQPQRQLALAGALLVAPFALVALLWVGLGPPWVATAPENEMRYLVLIVMAIAVASGVVMLKEALSAAGERFYSTLGFAAIILAGPLYLIWNASAFGAYLGKEHAGQVPPAIISLNIVLDLLISVGGGLTYLATAAIAASLGRIQWLGRPAARAYIILNVVAVLCLLIRGIHYPDPAATSLPWYASPLFIVTIPAVPFIMPFLLGVVLLRRAGAEEDPRS